MRLFFLVLLVITCEISISSLPLHAQAVYNPSIWSELVDKTWGEGRPTAEKLALFDTVWTLANRFFPYFSTKPPKNWDSLRTRFRPEIERGVSQGKFMAIMSRLVFHLNDVHISFSDRLFSNNASVFNIYTNRAPIFVCSPLETLGFCTTTLPDGSAMVYEADSTNPLKIKAGDIILGYNGMPWRTLLPTLINSDLPILGSAGSTAEHEQNILLASVLSNWHLFDNINILRADGKRVETLSTSLMVGWYGRRTFCRDGLPVRGVPRMSWESYYQQRNEAIWGRVEGTNIGYIYAHRCTDSLGRQFYNAVIELTQGNNPVDALILDLRRNDGGSISAFAPGWSQLYNQSVRWLSYAIRDTANVSNRNAMLKQEQLEPIYEQSLTTSPERFFTWYRYQPKFFDKPIAVLAGPGSVSAGDLFVHAMRYHPRARIFGKPSNGAFGSRQPWRISRDTVNINFTMPSVNFYDVRTKQFLGGRNYPIDEEVWLTQRNVLAGKDDVVEAAIRWIGTRKEAAVTSIVGTSAYPNPFTDKVSVRFNVARQSEKVTIRLMTMIGQELTSFEDSYPKGEHTVVLDAPNLSRGVYALTLQTQDKREIIKVVKN
jgi:hypothetical protein